MTTKSGIRGLALLAAPLLLLVAQGVAAQSAPGRVEFLARVAPTGSRPEPVRQLTFSLLRKSLEDIRAEALVSAPAPDLDNFIDGLKLSPELKAWMKKHGTVQLAGTDFIKSLTSDAIIDIPEFYDAYVTRNLGFKGVAFPSPKFKEKDREANPEKYEQAKQEFRAALKKFIDATPETVQSFDADLANINPYLKWQAVNRDQDRLLETRISDLAHSRYLAAQTDTDLDGRGAFARIVPGNYWIAMVDGDAISGDVRLRWDVPVSVRSGETTRVELSNVNAMKSNTMAQNSAH